MSKQVYISADYATDSGDRDVVAVLQRWGADDYHKVNFIDMSLVQSGSVANSPDCRPCDLKNEFNRQINASSAVVFIVGDKTRIRTAGSGCDRNTKSQFECLCTPYKQNANGTKWCKYSNTYPAPTNNVGCINNYSYLRHEFEQAVRAKKKIIIIYNSLRNEYSWIPNYMEQYSYLAHPFWKLTAQGIKTGDYDFIKGELGF